MVGEWRVVEWMVGEWMVGECISGKERMVGNFLKFISKA
jgi:hypothetical protein